MTIIQHKRGTASNWTTSNPVLAAGEIGYETDTGKFKIGDGASGWSTLSYFSSGTGSATVSSVALTVPTGLAVSGSPITTSGTLAISFDTGYAIPTTAKQTEWDTAYTDRLKWDGGSTGLDAATARTSLGLVIGTNVQAYDTDLAGIASATLSGAGFLKTNGSGVYSTVTDSSSNWNTAYGWGDHASAGYLTSLGIGSSTQAWDADLDAVAALSGTGLAKRTGTNTWTTITDNSANWDSAYTDRLKWDGGSSGLTASTGRTSLGATTVGSNLFTLTNPSATTFLKINADNSITAESASVHRASLGGTTVGENLFTLTNPSAITFLRVNADNTVSARSATNFRSDIGAGTGDGTVTTLSIVSANGFAGTVANATTTPAITLTTTITGLLSGNGTSISAASAGYGDTTSPYGTKAANRILAGPAAGVDAIPSFRTLVSADIPDLSGTYVAVSGGTAPTSDQVKTVSTATNASFYPVFVDANNGTATSEALYTDAGLVYNPSTNKLSTGGDISVNGGDLETTSTGTATLFNANATTLNIGGAATTVTLAASTGTTTIGNGLVLAAGTTSLAPLSFSSSTSVLSSPIAGAIEYNNANFFATPFTTSGRAVIESNYFYSNQSSIGVAGTSTGGAAISGSVFGVALPLATSTAYQVEATLYLQTSYTTNAPASQSITFSYPTGSTILAEGIIVQNIAAATTQSGSGSFYAMQQNTNRTLTVVTTSGNWHRFSLRGMIRTSTNAGSFSINFGATNGATPATLQLTTGANSFIKLTPVGSATSDNSIGAWA